MLYLSEEEAREEVVSGVRRREEDGSEIDCCPPEMVYAKEAYLF